MMPNLVILSSSAMTFSFVAMGTFLGEHTVGATDSSNMKNNRQFAKHSGVKQITEFPYLWFLHCMHMRS